MAHIGNKDTKFSCSNIGELKEAIAGLPDDMPLECEMENAIEVQVFTNVNDPEECYLDIKGEWDD